MKKVLAVLLTVALACSLVACGESTTQTTAAATTAASTTAAAAATTAAADTTTAAAGLEGTYSFNVGSSSTAGSTTSNVFEALQDQIKTDSNGAITMTYYGASSLGTDAEMVAECQNGNLPFVIVTSATLTSVIPEMGIFDMPCTATSMDEFAALFTDEDFMAEVQEWFKAAGLRLVACDTSANKLLASTRKIEKVEDFEGMDQRTLNNKYQIAFWQGLGANTIQIDASEIYLSIQQGLIEGVEFSMSGILSRKIYEVADYVIETMDLSQLNMVVMSDAVYQSMTANDQAWIDSYMAGVSETFTAASAEDVENGWKQLEEAGITCLRYNEELFQGMKKVAEETTWPLVREKVGDAVVDSFVAALERVHQ